MLPFDYGSWAFLHCPSCSGIDPAAQAFVMRFLLLSRATNLAYLAGADPTLHTALSAITDDQWMMLKGYLASLLPTYSSSTYDMFIAYGGAQIIAGAVQVGRQTSSLPQAVCTWSTPGGS
jgi:hypothetical protein